MTDREIIIDALRDYETSFRDGARNSAVASEKRSRWLETAGQTLRIRAELEDNADYVIRGGSQ